MYTNTCSRKSRGAAECKRALGCLPYRSWSKAHATPRCSGPSGSAEMRGVLEISRTGLAAVSGSAPNERHLRSWVEVSLEQLAANFHAIRAAVSLGVEVVPVVKADAYRHGALEVSRLLV